MGDANSSVDMTEKMKMEINRQYSSIRAFAKDCGVAHGTIVSALNNGIDGMAWGKVRKMCNCLNIDCGTFEPNYEGETLSNQEQRLLAYFSKLSEKGQKKTIEYMQDIL